jgi:two-component system CheB/CheR fusion protein
MRADDPAKRQNLLGTLGRQAGQMTRLLDDLLDASRVTQNKIELRREVLDLGQVTREAADAVRNLVESRGLRLHVDVANERVSVEADPARMQQIHVNLLTNAAKYTPRGGNVWMQLRRDGAEAVLRVRDDGAGIAPAMLESIFDLFVQSVRTLDRADGGLGVGLTLVKSLVGMHGGTVTAHSEGAGRGSEFVVRLPIASTEAAVSGAPVRQRLPPVGGARVVIVEDNDDSRATLSTFLAESGFRCTVANSGPAGLELIEETRPDVAIVDVGLPGMDGLELARRVRQVPALAGVYLIALTGYGQPTDRNAALAAGFDGHLVKPVDLDTLVEALARADVPSTAVPVLP